MLGTHYPNSSYLPSAAELQRASALYPLLRSADVTFGNLEGAFLDEGKPTKRCSNPAACYVFKTPSSLASEFAKAGFDLLSVANNHSSDFGSSGRHRTKQLLDSLHIGYAGWNSDPFDTVRVGDVLIGMTAFAPNDGTLPLNDLNRIRQVVRQVDSIADIVLFSFHGGAEGTAHQRIPFKRETYYGEDRGDVVQIAKTAIDAGADLILGHGPHVTRSLWIYNGRLVAFSLGNFWTYGRFNLGGPKGIAPILDVQLSADGRFQRGRIHASKQLGRGIPVIDSTRAVIQTLQKLMKDDFPRSWLQVQSDGTIQYPLNQIPERFEEILRIDLFRIATDSDET